jgi:hypothetical protein
MNTTTFTWDPSGEGQGLPVVLDDGSQYLYAAGLSAMKQSENWSFRGKDYLADGLGPTLAIGERVRLRRPVDRPGIQIPAPQPRRNA